MDLHPSYWPPELVCPISRSVMADPVIVASGETYERRCIEAWLELGQRLCVKQRTSLTSSFMIPNMAVKNAIASLGKSRSIEVFPIAPSQELAHALAQRLVEEKEHASRRRSMRGGVEGERWESAAEDRWRRSDASAPDNIIDDNGGGGGGRQGGDEGNDAGSGSSNSEYSARSRRGNGKGQSWEALRRGETAAGANQGSPTAAAAAAAGGGGGGGGGAMTWAGGEVAPPHHPHPHPPHHPHHHKKWGGSTFPTVGKYHTSEGGTGARSGHVAAAGKPQLPPDLATWPASMPAGPGPGPKQEEAEEAAAAAAGGGSSDNYLLVQRLQGPEPAAAAAELRRLTRDGGADGRLALCTPDVIAALVPLLRSPGGGAQADAAAALVNLSIERANKVRLVRAGAVPHLVHALGADDAAAAPEVQEHAAAALFSLALADENKNPIGVLNAIPALLRLLHPPSSSSSPDSRGGSSPTLNARLDAAMALYHLSIYPTNRSKLVRAGAVPVLLDLAESSSPSPSPSPAPAAHPHHPDLASRSLLILLNAAAAPEGRTALLELDAIARLVRLLALPPPPTAAAAADDNDAPEPTSAAADIPEQAAAVLLILSQGNMRFKSIALRAGAHELLAALAERGTPRAREKALALLAALKESSAAASGGAATGGGGGGAAGDDPVLPSHYFRRNAGTNSSAF